MGSKFLKRSQICSHTPSALNAGAKRSGATCHMAMPQCCYLAKGAKRPSHTTNTIKFDRIPFDSCNSIKRFDLCPSDQKSSTYLQPPGRMIEVYKILNECYDRKATEGLFELNVRETRGNPYQLKTKKPRLAIRKNFFAVAAVADWNSLPETVVRCDNVNAFKRSLDRHSEHKMFNTEFLVRNGQNVQHRVP